MTGVSRHVSAGHAGRLLIAHAVHVCLLLLPSLVLAGPWEFGWAIGCFAFWITAAGVLESLVLSPQVPGRDVAIRDKAAMRVALLVGICLLAVFWLAQIEWFLYRHSSLGLQATGGALVSLGIAFRLAAIRALGTQFVSDIQVGQVIVREGIFAWVGHPSEIGLLLIGIGGPLLIGSWVTAIAAAILLVPASLWRMVRENAALTAWR